MTIDPKTLTAEERAIVDVEACRLNALGARGLPQPEKVFHAALANVENLILARRKLYGEPQEAKRAGNVEYACQPAPPPATVASELPEAVEEAALALRLAVNPCDGSPSDERLLSAADALEAWARSLSATSGAQFPKVRAALTTFRTMNHHHHQGSTLRGCNSSMIDAAIAELDAAQAVPIGMTPELEQVLTAARHFIRPTFGLPESSSEKRLRAAIAAVRAQAKQPQAVPVEAIRALLNGITSREQRDAVRRYLAAVEGGK